MAGVTDAQLDAIMEDSNGEADSLRRTRARGAAAQGAEMVLPNMEGQLTPALYRRSLGEHFDDGEIFELGMVAAVLTGIAKFRFVYDLVEIGANAPHIARVVLQELLRGRLLRWPRRVSRIKEKLRYRLSMTHGCAFCNKGNVEAARPPASPTPSSTPSWLRRATSSANASARCCGWATRWMLPNMEGQLTPALYADLSAHFDDGEIFELGMVAAVLTGIRSSSSSTTWWSAKHIARWGRGPRPSDPPQ